MLLLLKMILSYLQVIFYQYGSDLIISNVISKLFYFFLIFATYC